MSINKNGCHQKVSIIIIEFKLMVDGVLFMHMESELINKN